MLYSNEKYTSYYNTDLLEYNIYTIFVTFNSYNNYNHLKSLCINTIILYCRNEYTLLYSTIITIGFFLINILHYDMITSQNAA